MSTPPRTTDPDYPMGPYPYDVRPKLAIIREINFKIDRRPTGDELVFYYSRYSRDKPLRSQEEFEDLLKEICSPNYRFRGRRSQPKEPFSTSLSLNSKEQRAYVIVKLAPRAWQFARSGQPFRIGAEGAKADAYYEARRVNRQGKVDPGDDPSEVMNRCMTAYFISDGPKAAQEGNYPHGFNIYVDLLVSGGDPMPIKIDPDVRHPGGSAE